MQKPFFVEETFVGEQPDLAGHNPQHYFGPASGKAGLGAITNVELVESV
jgi:hypothetical protein